MSRIGTWSSLMSVEGLSSSDHTYSDGMLLGWLFKTLASKPGWGRFVMEDVLRLIYMIMVETFGIIFYAL